MSRGLGDVYKRQSEDRAKVEEAIGHAMDAAVLMMQGETDKAMNIYN